MNSSQERHARSMAEHMLRYTNPFQSQMRSYAEADPGDLAHMSTEEFQARMYGEISSLVKELTGVMTDMTPVWPAPVGMSPEGAYDKNKYDYLLDEGKE